MLLHDVSNCREDSTVAVHRFTSAFLVLVEKIRGKDKQASLATIIQGSIWTYCKDAIGDCNFCVDMSCRYYGWYMDSDVDENVIDKLLYEQEPV